MSGSTDGPSDARPAVTWTAGEVAAELGIPMPTLRAWHRRYGVAPLPARPGAYRRYTDADVARLRRMHELVRSGTLPSDAARIVAGATTVSAPDELLVDVLVAARELDSARCAQLLTQAVTALGVVAAWEQLCRPALSLVDVEQRTTGPESCVDAEHVLSWSVTAAFHRVGAGRGVASGAAVLLSCTDDERHTLALEALAAALAERRIPVRMLGAAVPPATLVHAVTTSRPAAVVLWAQRQQTAGAEALRPLRRLPVRRVVAGPGWPQRPLAGAEAVRSLPAAVHLLTGAPA